MLITEHVFTLLSRSALLIITVESALEIVVEPKKVPLLDAS